ncbi:MAG TPA: TRAP transporter substrate-binding protein DctP [Deltaproteobacteria bacterium]|nr:TRAP transporter substrate-binding protein DctP [Deltaproteobacteria bacterium]HPJ94828.1 TRAP transporter substrate-binding protein DctP [Deltaproteobacteria bacterium]HPR52692.1 TRAP transporter substrate-binding protein DctP [Deltaproteobacteria bacterium]
MKIKRKNIGILVVLMTAAVLLAVPTGQSVAADNVKKIVWKSSGHGPASDPSQIYHDKLCNAITEATGGRLTVKPFVGGSIVPVYKELDAVDQGVLQMAYTCPMYNLDKWPAAGLISSRPGGLPGEALRTWFNYGGGADLMNKMMEGYNVMTFPGALSPLPEEVFFHSKVKLDSLKDIKGLKARCMGDGGEILKRMGAATVIIPGGELYEAMQRGTIDAFEYSTLASNWNMHFNEVAPYVYLSPTRAPSDPQVFFVNKKAWDALPGDLQVIVKSLIDKYTQAQHEYLVYESIKAVEKFKKAGNEVIKVPKDIEDALVAEAAKFYEEKSKKEAPIFGEIYYSMKEFGEAYNAIK